MSRVPFAAVAVLLALLAGGALFARSWLDDREQGRRSQAAATKAATPTPTVASGATATPSQTPSPPPSPKPHRGRLVIHGTGDVSVDPGYIPAFNSYGYGYAFSGLNGLFRRDDLTVINMECPVSRIGSPVPKEFNFECDPDALPAVREAGIEVASQGNNHAWDYGPEALVDSRQNLLRAGIQPVGSGKDPEQSVKPALFEIKGWKVAVVGIDQVVDPYPEELAAPGHPGTACGHDVSCMVRAVRHAAKAADLVIVVIHWGVELDTQPRSYQVDEAHKFVRAGADVIFGHHSHRLQPMSFVEGRPVFWGLGNFVWPHLSEEGSITAVGEVVVTPNGKFKARLLPAYIESDGHPVLR